MLLQDMRLCELCDVLGMVVVNYSYSTDLPRREMTFFPVSPEQRVLFRRRQIPCTGFARHDFQGALMHLFLLSLLVSIFCNQV